MAEDLARRLLGPGVERRLQRAYEAHHHGAQLVALGFLNDSALAEDAVHRAFLAVLKYYLAGHEFENEDVLRRVIYRNTRWAALKILRARRRHPEEPMSVLPADLSDEWSRSEARWLCARILAALPERYRRALELRYIEQVSTVEGARLLDITPKAYERRLARALAAARRTVDRFGPFQLLGIGATLPLPHILRSVSRGARRAALGTAFAVPLAAVISGGAAIGAPRAGETLLAASNRLPQADTTPPAVAGSGDNNTMYVSAAGGVAGDGHHVLVLLGESPACQCWHLSRSDDGGATWQHENVPLAGALDPRLAVSPGFPQDPRIGIETGSGDPLLFVTTWGLDPVGATPALLQGLSVAPAALCTGTSGPICPRTPEADSGSVSTLVVDLKPSWLVGLPSHGGMQCSVDSGGTWQPQCG